MSDSRQNFGLEIVFIDHFNTQFVITLIYSAIVNFHALRITKAQLSLFHPQRSTHVVDW